MAEYPALPLFTDAYLADTQHLTAAQHGAYLLMLMTAWRTAACSLPNDDNFLSRICRMDKRTWLANKSVLLEFWEVAADGKLLQKRLKDERKYVEDKRNKNVQAGRASALKKKERHSTGVATKPQPKQNQPTPTPNSDTNVSGESNESPSDFKKVLFTEGLKMLGGEKYRSLIGQWLSKHGEVAVCSAFLAAQKQSAIDPKTYIIKVLEGNYANTVGNNANDKSKWASAADAYIAKHSQPGG